MTETEQAIVSLRANLQATFDDWKANDTASTREALAKMNTDLNALCDRRFMEMKAESDAKQASLEAKFAEHSTAMEAKFRRFGEQHAALPTHGGGNPAYKTFGQTFVEHADIKTGLAAASFGRKDRMVATLNRRIAAPQAKAITEGASGFVLLPQRVGVFATPPDTPLVMRGILPTVPLGAFNAVEYLQETWTYNADYQATEGAKKAESSVAWVEKIANVRTIAHFVKISRQMMADVPYVASTIDDKLIYGVLKKEDTELLFGANGAGQLHGLMPQATLLAGTVLASDILDELLRAITAVSVAGYMATNIVMNPADYGALQIKKNGQGLYMLGGPLDNPTGPRLWGLPVSLTPVMTARSYLVGQFTGGTATIYDRETATVDVAYENEDDFVKNMVCIRGEERIAFAVTNPAAFVKVVHPATE